MKWFSKHFFELIFASSFSAALSLFLSLIHCQILFLLTSHLFLFNRTKGYTEDEKRLTKKIMRYWANFARTGDPNRHPEGPITSDWPVYTPNGKEYLTLDTGDRKIIGKGM